MNEIDDTYDFNEKFKTMEDERTTLYKNYMQTAQDGSDQNLTNPST